VSRPEHLGEGGGEAPETAPHASRRTRRFVPTSGGGRPGAGGRQQTPARLLRGRRRGWRAARGRHGLPRVGRVAQGQLHDQGGDRRLQRRAHPPCRGSPLAPRLAACSAPSASQTPGHCGPCRPADLPRAPLRCSATTSPSRLGPRAGDCPRAAPLLPPPLPAFGFRFAPRRCACERSSPRLTAVGRSAHETRGACVTVRFPRETGLASGGLSPRQAFGVRAAANGSTGDGGGGMRNARGRCGRGAVRTGASARQGRAVCR
jgi:hypothetical protein